MRIILGWAIKYEDKIIQVSLTKPSLSDHRESDKKYSVVRVRISELSDEERGYGCSCGSC